MALALITGKKFVMSQQNATPVFYIANTQDDGFTYFNDDVSYRYGKFKKDDEEIEVIEQFYIPKQIWMQCTAFEELNLVTFDPLSAILGGSSVAPIESVEKAVQWMINKVQNNYITYSQSNRNLKNVDGKSYDCSSFVITGFYAAGVDINASYTGDMVAGFTAKGWEFIAGSRWEASKLQRGDILINTTHHTQVYIGNNKDVNCGSTPARIVNHNEYYTYGGANGWTGILRYKGTTGGVIP